MFLFSCLPYIRGVVVPPSTEIQLYFIKEENWMSTTYILFCCNVRDSHIISWEINGHGIGLFHQDLEEVIANDEPDFSYSASLLSLRQGSAGYIFDSVLIISAPHKLQVNVSCLSDFKSNSTSNLVTPMNEDVFSPKMNFLVFLIPLLISNSPIVTRGNVPTGALICASNTSYDQSWETDTNDHLAFSSNSPFGMSRNRLTRSGDTLRLHAISLGLHHQNFVSILFLTDGDISKVSCVAGGTVVDVDYPIKRSTTSTREGMFKYFLCVSVMVYNYYLLLQGKWQ